MQLFIASTDIGLLICTIVMLIRAYKDRRFSIIATVLTCALTAVITLTFVRDFQNRKYVADDIVTWNKMLKENPIVADAIREVTGKDPFTIMHVSYFRSFEWPWYGNGYFYMPCPISGKMCYGGDMDVAPSIHIGPGTFHGCAIGTEVEVAKINQIIETKTHWPRSIGVSYKCNPELYKVIEIKANPS